MCGIGTHRGRRSGGIRAISVADRGPYPARWTRKDGWVCASGRRWNQAAQRGERARVMLAKHDGPTTDLEEFINSASLVVRAYLRPRRSASARPSPSTACVSSMLPAPADPRPASIISVSPSPPPPSLHSCAMQQPPALLQSQGGPPTPRFGKSVPRAARWPFQARTG